MAHDSIIDEAVGQLAGYFASILADRQVNKNERVAKLFEDFSGYLKASTAQAMMFSKADDDPPRPMEKLNEMIAAMIAIMPDISPAHALRYLTTPAGAALINSLSKSEKDNPMTTRSDEMQQMRKFVEQGGMSAVAQQILKSGGGSLNEHEFTALVQEESKRKGVSFEKAFEDPDTARAYAIVRDAGHVRTYMKSFPGTMSVDPVSVGGQDAMDVNNATKAVAQLKELAAQQHKTFEQVMLENPELTARTYTAAHRPNSSPSDAYLQR